MFRIFGIAVGKSEGLKERKGYFVEDHSDSRSSNFSLPSSSSGVRRSTEKLASRLNLSGSLQTFL